MRQGWTHGFDGPRKITPAAREPQGSIHENGCKIRPIGKNWNAFLQEPRSSSDAGDAARSAMDPAVGAAAKNAIRG
jgi:hypothetical protein